MQSDKSRIFGVSEKGGVGTGIIAAPGLDEKILLKAMSFAPEYGRANIVDHLTALVADRILSLNLKDALALVSPSAAFLHRQVRVDDSFAGGDGTLFSLWRLLHETRNSAERTRIGLKLGDMGLAVLSGLFGAKHLKRVMKSEEIRRYANGMATSGYGEAMLAASRLGRGEARSVRADAPVILERMDDVVEVLSGFSGGRVRGILGNIDVV